MAKGKLSTMRMEDIRPYPNNPRRNDGAVDAVAESIRQCGYVAPIIVDEDGVILAGHTRYKALQKLGYKTVDVLVKSGMTEEQKKKYRLLDNKTGELADWDYDLLEMELDGLDFGSLDLDWGIDMEEAPEVAEDNYEVAPPEEPKSKPGDIYQLGRHRLMCGDSTSIDAVETLMGGRWPTWCLLTRPMDTTTRAICGRKPSGLMCSRMMIKSSTSSRMCGLCAMGSFLSVPHGRCLINGFPFSKNTTTLPT